MSQYTATLVKTMTASGAVTGKRFVDFSGAQVASAGAKALGVALYDAADGEPVAVVVQGTAVVEAGGAIAVGDNVAADANGRAVVATPASGYTILGIALEAASAAGEEIEVLLVSPIVTA